MLLLFGSLSLSLYFETYILELKMVLDQWLELVHDVGVLIDVLACFLGSFIAVFVVLGHFPFDFFGYLYGIFVTIFALSCQSKGQFY